MATAAATALVRPFPFDALARLARSQVEAGRALRAHLPLADEKLGAALATALGGPVAIELVEAYAFPARELRSRLGGPPPPSLIRLSGSGGRSALLALEPALAARLARRAGGASVEGLVGAAALSAGEQAALAELLGPACAAASARIDGFVALGGDGERELAAGFGGGSVLALDARVRSPVGHGWARLLAPDGLRLSPPPPRRFAELVSRRPRLDPIRVALRIEIGRTRLEGRELAGLEPGDVILFEEFGPRPPLGGPLWLRLQPGTGAGGRFRAHLDGEGLTVVKGFELGVPTMEPPDRDDAEEPRPSSDGDDGRGATDALLRELPVEVTCELGRVTMSGRELLELRAGAVIPVGRPLAGPVDLTVGGRVLARGELVDVEGEIGVRVTQMLD